jgi:hypothetical protein
VKLWCENRVAAIDRYGHISLWDTHRVTDKTVSKTKILQRRHQWMGRVPGDHVESYVDGPDHLQSAYRHMEYLQCH